MLNNGSGTIKIHKINKSFTLISKFVNGFKHIWIVNNLNYKRRKVNVIKGYNVILILYT